jgi:hypothetical protein
MCHVYFTAFGNMAPRGIVILLPTKKPAVPIFRVEDAMKRETGDFFLRNIGAYDVPAP